MSTGSSNYTILSVFPVVAESSGFVLFRKCISLPLHLLLSSIPQCHLFRQPSVTCMCDVCACARVQIVQSKQHHADSCPRPSPRRFLPSCAFNRHSLTVPRIVQKRTILPRTRARPGVCCSPTMACSLAYLFQAASQRTKPAVRASALSRVCVCVCDAHVRV